MLEEHEMIELVIKVITMEASPSEVKKLRDWAALSDENRDKICRYHNKELLDPSFDVARGFNGKKNWSVLQDRIRTGKAKRKTTGQRETQISYLTAAVVIGLIIWKCVNSEPHTNTGIYEKAITLENDGRYKTTYVSAGRQSEKKSDHVILLPACGFLQKQPLPDDSKYWLNSLSIIRYSHNFKHDDRKVILKGEAYFEIKRQKHIPLQFIMDSTVVESKGGSFNIASYDEDEQIIVTSISDTLWVTEPEIFCLAPGQSAVFKKGQKIEVVQADIEKVLSWKNREFIFKNEKASLVVSELRRWYGLKVQLEIPPNTPVSYVGSRENEFSEVANTITETNNLLMEIKDGVLFLKSKPSIVNPKACINR